MADFNEYDQLIQSGGLGEQVDRNEYDDMILREETASRTQLRSSLYEALQTDPDQYAQAHQLAKRSGLPAPVVARNFEQVRRNTKLNEYDALLTKHPELLEAMQDPDTASIAHDDLENLSTIDWLLKAPQRAYARGQAQEQFGRLSYARLFDAVGPEQFGELERLRGEMQRGGELGADSWMAKALVASSQQLPMLFGGLKAGLHTGLQGAMAGGSAAAIAGQLGPQIAAPEEVATVPAAALTGYYLGQTSGAAQFGLEQEAGHAYEEFLSFRDENGLPLDPGVAKVAALTAGAINSGLEAFQINTLLRAIPGADKLAGLATRGAVRQVLRSPTVRGALTDMVKSYGGVLARETATEVVQRAVTIMSGELAKVISEGDFEARGADDVAQDLGNEASQALTAFALLAAPGPLMSGTRDAIRAREAKQSAAVFQALGEGAAESKTRTRLPEKFQQLVERMTAGGPLENVYVSPDTWTRFWQDQGVDPRAVAMEVLGDAQSYDQAVATGAELAIPTARYAAKLAATPHNQALLQELRTSPEAMNAREADAWLAEQQAAPVVEAPVDMPTDPAARVGEDIVGQLLGAGFERSTAESYGQLFTSVFNTLGQRIGIDPLQLFSNYNLKIVRDLPEVLTRSGALDNLDVALDRLRTGDVLTEQAVRGPSLLEFLRERGVQDEGGELSARDIDADRKPFQRRLAREDGVSLDHAAELAAERGYIPERDINLLLETIDTELRGQPRYAVGAENARGFAQWQDLQQLQDYLDQLGVDLQSVDNATVRAQLLDTAEPQTEADGVTLEQTGGKKGYITIGRQRMRIALLENADLSTLLHEAGHFYLEVLGDLAQAENAPQALRDDYQAVLDWLSVSSRDAIGTPQHEQWARGFEAYLMEGKAPSAALRSAFARFRAWLVSIYRTVRGLNVTLSEDVRAVMDRLVATDEEIAAAQAQQDMTPLFTGAEQIGMSAQEFAGYQTAVQEARTAAEDELTAKHMAEVKREQEAWWKEARTQVRAEVSAEVDRQPVYIALSVLQRGVLPDGSALPIDADSLKFSRDALVETYGKDFLKRLPRPYVYTREGGAHPDMVAELLGFSSGDELVRALAGARPREALIEAETDVRMRQQFGDLRFDGTAPVQAMQAVHNDKRAELLRKELEYLAAQRLPALKNVVRRITGRIPPVEALRAEAERAIAALPVRQINPLLYQRAEVKAARLAREAMLRGDLQAAFHEKLREARSHEHYRAASRAREDVERIVKYAGKFDTKAVRARIGKAGADYLEQIDALLNQYEFRQVTLRQLNRRRGLRDWIDRLERDGTPHAVPEEVIADARQVNHRELPYEFLRGVHDALRAIEHLASTKGKLLLGQEQRSLEDVVTAVTSSIYGNAQQGQPSLSAQGRTEQLRRYGRGVLGAMLNADTITRELDGFQDLGPVYEHIKAPIDRAMTEQLIPMQNKAGEELEALYAVYSRAELRALGKQRIHIPEIGDSLTKMEILAMALNWGNEGNRQALVESTLFMKRGVGFAGVQAALNHLDKRDWDFVQSVWDYVDSYWPQIAESQRRRTGLVPDKVQPTSVETKYGNYRGGYYPLKYDSDRSLMVDEEQAEEIAKNMRAGRFAKAATRRGHTITRKGSGGRPVLLDLSVLHQHINQVTYDLALGDAVAYAVRVLHSFDVRRAFEDTGKLESWQALDIWAQDVAAGEIITGDALSKGMRWVRTGFTASVLGWNIGTALIQPTGYAQTMAVIGPKYAYRGVQALLSRPWHGERGVFAQVYAQSTFMRDRSQTFNKDIGDALRQMKGGLVPDALQKSMFWLILQTQKVVDVATWLGAYQKGQTEFADPADAVRYADRIVARAQASGLFSDRTALERGTLSRNVRQAEFVRIWTALASYMMAKANVAYEKTYITNFRDPLQVLRWTGDMVLLFTVEALLMAAIRGAWPDEDDDDPAFVLKQTASAVLGTVPFVREFASEAQGFRGGGAFGAFTGKAGDAYRQIEQGELDAALVKNINSVGGILFHYPSSQMNRFIDAAWRDAEGEDVGLLDYLIYREKD
ncbi:MAG TPA: hypothetical protein VIN36_09140 [Thiobacillus sp.]